MSEQATFQLSNRYAQLGSEFGQQIPPHSVTNPFVFLWNDSLADELGITPENGIRLTQRAEYFSGNRLLPGSEPFAMAYAGHQFGNFVPQLGDGRAHLLGDVCDSLGNYRELQLKGSGPTAFSRNGDGRYAMGPAIREFIMSEAMHALGISTTRCLSVINSDETVFRETPQRGSIVTRVAASHVRVGSFEFFAARGNYPALEKLADYVIARHYPEITNDTSDRFVQLLDAAMQKQIALIVDWLRVGFIHGVMNTDNTALSGETIDFGPCAMLGVYDRETVYSSIDRQGRYAFGNQPTIAQWNMARFAETLIPLVDKNEEKAIDKVSEVISNFPQHFINAFHRMMANKLGIFRTDETSKKLIDELLELLQERQLDYTISFNWLTRSLSSTIAKQQALKDFGNWFEHWQHHLEQQPQSADESQQLMQKNNPQVIARNHHMEAVLASCLETGLPDAANDFLDVLRSPYELTDKTALYQDAPSHGDRDYKTFCGT